jgi:succinate dehydrogenase/fumarate reductase flavoprotein subunit
LNEVHPLDYEKSDEPHEVYDLVVIGAGAGGLVSSKQVRSRARGCKEYAIYTLLKFIFVL